MEQTIAQQPVFSFFPENSSEPGPKGLSLLARPLEAFLGLRQCARIYNRICHHDEPLPFLRQVLSELGVRPAVDTEDLEKIPMTGGCVLVANHPFGGIEGVILVSLLLGIRSDVKIMANFVLNRIPQLRPITIAVDPFDPAAAARVNLGPLLRAMRWVKQGGLLLVFPAGEVSHLNVRRREVCDPAWNISIARIVHYAKATVVPVFFEGRNSAPFQAAGLVHPRLRTLLLVRELLNKKGAEIRMKIGQAISYRWLRSYTDPARLMEYLRWRTYIMGHPQAQPHRFTKSLTLRPSTGRQEVTAHPQPTELCRMEISKLPAGQRLVQSGPFAVWHAQADQIPHVLLEIGRLREISFRPAGEGTGKARDLDAFDRHYLHLFIWNEERSELVGAYRIGQTDRILPEKGQKGLYTATLFRSGMDFYRKIGPALELGRSFVRPEYQKSYSPLLLLWKGIGAFVARHPRYRTLFGPVSISRDYSDLSRRLIASTLMRHSQAEELALMVRPKKPARLGPVRIRGCSKTTHDVDFQDFKEVCSVIADIEIGQKEVPVLLRQYLNLGGRILSFNIDKLFSDVMDALVVVDLLQSDRKALERYMGAEGLFRFLAHHYAAASKDKYAA